MKMIKNNGEHAFVISRPTITKPEVVRKFKKDGIQYYECTGGRVFIAAKYDEMFGVKKGTVKPKGYKGSNNFKKMKEN
ncbi:hypothetical protein QTN47_27255 [Danxiaibacter flavus]|uniref:Uncharacterized protein n=1 Tax=Danxiaibacter flavus TaxID=3049108 RepID=A0ABV3ZN40_9BACT|nr:hypothetical protein QNM32_27255 [Chitinophagaceae bacterium DXS]